MNLEIRSSEEREFVTDAITLPVLALDSERLHPAARPAELELLTVHADLRTRRTAAWPSDVAAARRSATPTALRRRATRAGDPR